VIDKSRLVERLEPYLIHEVGRSRMLPLRALLVSFQINALQRHHQAHLVQEARVLNAMSDRQRGRVGITGATVAFAPGGRKASVRTGASVVPDDSIAVPSDF